MCACVESIRKTLFPSQPTGGWRSALLLVSDGQKIAAYESVDVTLQRTRDRVKKLTECDFKKDCHANMSVHIYMKAVRTEL